MALRDAKEVGTTPDGVIGRERELAAVDRFLVDADWPRVLRLEGGPGIGKTTLWTEACRRARARGVTLLACRASQAEVALAFGSLVDLFETVPDSVLDDLPDAQRVALRVALRRRTPDRRRPDDLAVSAGARAAIGRLVSRGRVLIAVDDFQWLDASTAAVLAYVARRLGNEPVGLLVAERSGTGGLTAGDPGSASLDALPNDHVTVARMSLSTLHHVIRSRTGAVLARPVLHRVAEASGGNPLFAIELTSALLEGGALPGPGDPLPAPRTLLEMLSRRVDRLPAAARDALLVVASLSTPTEDAAATVLGTDPTAGLEAARRAGILDAGVDPLRFAHPLYAQCVMRLAAPARRRDIHRRIADIVDEPEERARHLALAGDPPDDVVAAALDQGAIAARRRGALRAASELLELARRFTSQDEPAAGHRRAFEAAELAVLAGDRSSAREWLAGLVTAAESPLRERAVGLYAEILTNQGEADEAERLLRDARASSPSPSIGARLDLDLAYGSLVRLDVEEAAICTERALAAARVAGDAKLLAESLAYEALARLLAGREVDEDRVAEAIQLEEPDRPPYMGLPPGGVIGLVRAFSGRHDEARMLLDAAGDALDAIGDDCDLAHVLLWSSWLEMRAGRLAVAAAHARNAATMAESTGSELLRAWGCVQAAQVAASEGDPAATDALVAEAARDGPPSGIVAVWAAAAVGLSRLAMGDPTGAAAAYAGIPVPSLSAALPEPIPAYFVPDAAEALARAGMPDAAQDVLAPFEVAAHARGRAWAVAAATRARSVMLAERGDLAGAIAGLRTALELHEQVDLPLERARVLLHLGRLERRTGERRSARTSLEAAAAGFEATGATGWADQARAELGRIPGRREGLDTLTAAERRVAELSGAGRTNREVAAALFVTPKTVEASLTRIYRKLGITTRAELGAWVVRTGTPPDPPKP